ncbi:hypothetical protein DE146DRAFT_681695 [Phaeosphaeria sp. MPI-PUGE-AT-0046c]|nr:hypothetical protein DE146DRAFT_681695 [Phaeosphaeria sp. MPI-PUGE-AT-0046c]
MPQHLKPLASASPTYCQLHTTALAFIDAQAQTAEHPSRMNFEKIEALCTTEFQQSWGHNYAISLSPRLQGTHSFSEFRKHLAMMLPSLESWETTVTEVIVDEAKRKVVLRISFWMRVKGAEEMVENDLLWVLEMDDTGEKVKKSVEFVDGIAAGKIKEIILANGPRE